MRIGRLLSAALLILALPSIQAAGVGSGPCEVQVRTAGWGAAEDCYRSLLEQQPMDAATLVAAGHLYEMQFRRAAAERAYRTARQLNPQDLNAVLALAGLVADPVEERTLLNEAVRLAPHQASRWAPRRRLLEELAGSAPWRLSSAYREYRVPLLESSDSRGVLVRVRLNNGPVLRLLVDTGARGLLVHAEAGRSSELLELGESGVVGIGSRIERSTAALARRVRIGSELEWADAPVQVTHSLVVEGADGLLGTDVLQAFQVTLRPARRELRLTPFEGVSKPGRGDRPWHNWDRSEQQASDLMLVRRGHLLLARVEVNGRARGLFLVDTGAAQSVLARPHDASRPRVARVSLTGVAGRVEAYRLAPLALRIGSRRVVTEGAASSDLTSLEEGLGLPLEGLLGFEVLGRMTITLDYRDGTMRVGGA